ncbi:DUF2971 domain-containing protein [Phenylobacterium sp.]|uniref:DUF2971 domain-containing protein n=1 Tax=Phenylobacterium sp. TaxID=1871053 RepID=UPI00289DD3E4|nr:DUF2971 domain-containing protein [Phenylobacterium sp.]
MFYKFMGGVDEAALLDIFEKAVVGGSFKFGAAWAFNDPFEFKFNALPPSSREAFEAWHRKHAPERTPQELENAWASFQGPTAHWNTELAPRIEALSNFYVLCLAQRWDSHLMWGHYTNSHRGFVICYKPELQDVLRAMPEHVGDGNVVYAEEAPALRWFDDAPEAMCQILSTKPSEWAYERECRFVNSGPPGWPALFSAVDPQLIDGVILGVRAPEGLIKAACRLRAERPGFKVEQVTSERASYALVSHAVNDKVRSIGEIL